MNFRTILFLLLSLFCIKFVAAQTLNGTYTIGGVNPNYASLNLAAAALNTNGISGPVTFLIRSGTYNEQFALNQIVGSSSTNSIHFTSESGDSTDVVIQHLHTTSSQNYTVYFNETDYITLSHITLKVLPNTSTSYESIVNAKGSCTNVVIKNCRIESIDPSFSSNQFALNFDGSTGQADFDSISVLNNYIFKGAGGVYINGDSLGASEFNNVKGNIFYDQSKIGFKTFHAKNSIVVDNQFLRPSPNTAIYTGVILNYNLGYAKIQRNYFNLHGNSRSFVLNDHYLLKGDDVLFENNILIQLNNFSNPNITGMSIQGRPKVKLLHNTIEITTAEIGTANSCFSLSGIDTAVVLNNILAINGPGHIYSTFVVDSLNFNYNNLSKSIPDSIAFIEQAVVSTLSDLQNNYGLEGNSYSIPPNLVGTYNHIPSNSACYDNGIPLSAVTTDFFGTPRSIIMPDIGAYEGNPLSLEIGFITDSLLMYGSCLSDSVDVFIQVYNYGTDTITQMNIHAGGTVIPWVGVINPGTLSGNILATQVYIQNSSALQLPPIWVSLPNGIQDGFAQNDTIHTVIYPAMGGSYTVGNNTADFLSLKNAADKLNEVGVCAPVVLTILDGVYDEQVMFNSIEGVSDINTIKVQSNSLDSTSVTLKYTTTYALAATSPIIGVQDVSYISFLSLGFEAPISNSARLFEITGNCDSVEVSHCLFQKVDLSYNSATAAQNRGLVIVNNRFLEGVNQIVVYGNPSGQLEEVNIQDNIFSATTTLPKYLNIKHAQNIRVEQNEYTGLTSYNSFVLDECKGPIWIDNNNFNLTNYYELIQFTNLTGDSLNGVYITNNRVVNSGHSVLINNCDYLYFYHNTLKSSLVLGGNNTHTFVKNNLFFDMKYNGFADLQNVTIDYNGLTTTNPNHIFIGNSGITLTTFQGFYQQQYNSLNLPAHFASSSDLHLYNSYNYDNTGTPVAYSNLDMDGEVRSSVNPDMGADEFDMDFSVITNNIKLNKIIKPDTNSCFFQDSLIIQIVNNSNTIVDSVLVMTKLFESVIDSFYVTQSMNPNDTIVIDVGQYDFNFNTRYDLDFSVSLPNGLIDEYPVDNFLNLNYSFIENCKIYSKPIDDCLTDTQLFIKDYPRHSVLWSTGETTSKIVVNSPGSYGVTVVFNNGCTVTDTITIN